MPRGSVQAHYRQESPEERAVESWGGIVSARVEDLARELDTTPEELLDAMGRTDVDPLVDTARQKKQERDRPTTDYELRSLALTTEQLDDLRSELNAEGYVPQR